MKLLAILMSLCIERLINPGLFLHRFAWFPTYLNYLQNKLSKPLIWHGFLGVVVISLPLLIIAAMAYYLLGGFTSDMAKELIAIAILIYCLGPGDTRRQLEGFITSIQENDIERANHYLDFLPASITPRERAVSEHAIISFNEEIFALLFWFSVLGPLGALFYRLTTLIERYTQVNLPTLYGSASILKGIIDWLPIRALGFSFTLVGNFTSSFHFLSRKVMSSYNNNQIFLQTIGLIAVGADPNDSASANVDEHKALLALFDRTLVIWLV
ncbi:MAG: rane protein required for beta-lactamase induction, partial [Gammaproteobacteria bacterium]|nr:rane protein required for beta-lactamase induction [Gammaproteobacteria bacterium]